MKGVLPQLSVFLQRSPKQGSSQRPTSPGTGDLIPGAAFALLQRSSPRHTGRVYGLRCRSGCRSGEPWP